VSTTLLDDLLAAFTAPTAAKAANPAKNEYQCGFRPALRVCEGLRIAAKPVDDQRRGDADSQAFAAVRKPQIGSKSAHLCGSSQDSQDSQGYPAHCSTLETFDMLAKGWTDADIARFLDRRARLMRWGWPQVEAEKLADRLVRRGQGLGGHPMPCERSQNDVQSPTRSVQDHLTP
jgi:hypothetical protein